MLPHLPNDEPTVEDLLGHAEQVDEVLDLLQRVQPPYVLGVHGDWGCGKTSFLYKLQAALGDNKVRRKTRVIFFEAWRHQFEEQPVVALLHTIREHFSLERRVWEKSGKLASVTAWTGLRLLDDLAAGVVQAAREEGEGWERRNLAVPLASEAFHSAFQQAIKAFTGAGDARLVVLIDDLDRCSDASVVRLLEGLKLFLRAENCVFVIAADRRAIVRAIARELFEGPDHRRNAEEYAEKLFQSVFVLGFTESMERFVQKHWLLAQPTAAQLVALQDRLRFLPPNPRKAKRFLVELDARLRAHARRAPAQVPDLGLFCAVQAVQTFHPDLYRILQAEPEFWADIAAFASEVATDAHEVFKDLKVPDRKAGQQASPVRTFHDPGDQAVFWAARVVREFPAPSDEALYRALLREPPKAQAAPA